MTNKEASTANLPKKVLITGADGFIGSRLMQRFIELGAEVVGVSLKANPARGIHAADVSKAGDWQALMQGCDLVVHTAAVVSNSAPEAAYRTVTLGGTVNTVEAAIAAGVKRMVHLSSIAAYGLEFSSERVESDPIALFSGFPYCDAKAASEHPVLAAHASGKLQTCVIRPGDVYGPGSRPWVLIPLEMIRKNRFMLPAHGKGHFSPIYIDDLIDAVVLAATRPEASGEVFNITGDKSVSCAEFFTQHWRWAGKSGKPPMLSTALMSKVALGGGWLIKNLLRQPTEISPGSIAMLTRTAGYSNQKAKDKLGFSPQVDLAEGFARTQTWLKSENLI